MFCPFCTHEETKVVDSRLVANGSQIKRRRECINCGERFSTYEEAELVMPRIIKSNERREPFDEEKLRAGLHKACLLYTSPSPRDRYISRMPSSA